MKKIFFFLALSAAVFACSVAGSEEVESLRGGAAIPAGSNPAVGIEWQPADAPIATTSVHQPPLIAHSVKDMTITTAQNDCLGCHGVKDSGAPAPYKSHYADRDGKVTKAIAPLWYFCTQCHVGQVDAKPLVENVFKTK
jgi:cytochrome c-type protein NapB